MLACTRTAISALAWPVSATCPPIPAVLRPALRCVTCRTLTSVLLQLRSASFCRFLASGQSPACTALKIRPRSRRTCSSWRRQSTRSQASPSNEGRPSGPFTEVPNVPVSSGIYARFASKAHLPTSAPLRARASRSLSGQLYEHRPGGDPALRHSPSRCLSAAGIRFPGTLSRQRGSAPLTIGLPAGPHLPAPAGRTLARFPRSARMRPGPGRTPSIPRGQRCSLAVDLSAAAACRLSAAGPWHPGTTTQPGMYQ